MKVFIIDPNKKREIKPHSVNSIVTSPFLLTDLVRKIFDLK